MDSRAYYDSLAASFEEEDDFWDNPYDSEVWRLEHELIRPYLNPSRPLLDLGCGFYPHDKFPTSTSIVAGDISFASLNVAKRHSPGCRRVELIQLDAHALPFVEGSFTQALAGGELLNHVEYKKVLAELARVICGDGILLIEFGTKWCLDSLWAITDSLIGHRIGYSVTKEQAKNFFKFDGSDPEVTWEITPRGKFTVKLLAAKNVRRALETAGFTTLKTLSTNLISGIIPLPWQQDVERTSIQRLASLLIGVDRKLGKLYPINVFGGNFFMLCKRRRY